MFYLSACIHLSIICFFFLHSLGPLGCTFANLKKNWNSIFLYSNNLWFIYNFERYFIQCVLNLYRQNRCRQEHMQPRCFFSFINYISSELCNSVTREEKHLVLSHYRYSAFITQFEPNKQNTWLRYFGPCSWDLWLTFTHYRFHSRFKLDL